MTALLEVKKLSVELATPRGWIKPVNEVSLQIGAGEAVGLVGESGSGKTMLSLALMGLLPEGSRVSGEALQDGTPLTNLREEEWRSVRGKEIAMIFQEPMTSLNPVMKIGAQIEEAIRTHEKKLEARAVRERTLDALRKAAVPEPELRAEQYPHQLSGGLRQRAMIAMALAAGPKLLIADEPTTALDVTVQKQILELLRRLRGELQLGLLFITHDLGVVSQVADRVAVMYAGRVVEQGQTKEVLSNPKHPYTQGLLEASPKLQRSALKPIPGVVPQLFGLPPGCSFEPRCGLRKAECTRAVPELRSATPGHEARCILV